MEYQSTYSFWVSYFFDKDGTNGHGACEMKISLGWPPETKWNLTADGINDWTQKINTRQGFDNLVIVSISPMFGNF